MVKFDQAGFQVEIGLRIREYRRVNEMTQTDLGERLGLSRPLVANIECGRQRVAADVLWRAAIVFKIPVWRLMPPQNC